MMSEERFRHLMQLDGMEGHFGSQDETKRCKTIGKQLRLLADAFETEKQNIPRIPTSSTSAPVQVKFTTGETLSNSVRYHSPPVALLPHSVLAYVILSVLVCQ